MKVKCIDKEVKKRLVKSKCMADMFVWLGFEYKKVDEGYLFKRTYEFNYAWEHVHFLRNLFKK